MGGELSVKPVRAITWTDVGGREASLIHRCAARDEDACAELVSEHQRMVYQLSLNLLNDHNEALDLSQEVFLRVFRTIHTFRGHSSLRTWIYRIVVNQATTRAAGERTFSTLERACQTFLGRAPGLAGIVRRDERVRDAIRRQTLLLSRHPNAPAANDVEAIARLL